MQKEAQKENCNVVICPPCGENVGLPTKRGLLNEEGIMNNPPLVLWTTSLAQRRKETTRGFTLIELLVVVLIIAILAAVVLPQYQFAVEKARYMELITMINGVEKEAQLAFLEGKWPEDTDDVSVCTNFDSWPGDSSGVYSAPYFKLYIDGGYCTESEVHVQAYAKKGRGAELDFDFFPDKKREIYFYPSEDIDEKICKWLAGVYGNDFKTDCN